MKKMFFLTILATMWGFAAPAWADVLIDEAHFPDPEFREYLEAYDGWKYNEQGDWEHSQSYKDNILSDKEISQIMAAMGVTANKASQATRAPAGVICQNWA